MCWCFLSKLPFVCSFMRPPPSLLHKAALVLECDVFGHLYRLQFRTWKADDTFIIVILTVMVIIVCFQIFFEKNRNPTPFPLGFKPRCRGVGVAGASKAQWLWCPGSHPSGQVGHWAVQQQTRRPRRSEAHPPGSHSSLLILPLLVSPVCQGQREAGAASLFVCVVGMACVSFLVFGLTAGLSP